MRIFGAIAIVAVACGGGGAPAGGDDDAVGSIDAPAGGAVALQQVKTFWLPIDSERFGASGLAAAAGVCIGLDWDFSNLGMAHVRHCDDFVDRFPYAVVRAATGGACDETWDYQGNAVVVAVTGCIQPDFTGGSAHVVDLHATLDGPLFSGAIAITAP